MSGPKFCQHCGVEVVKSGWARWVHVGPTEYTECSGWLAPASLQRVKCLAGRTADPA